VRLLLDALGQPAAACALVRSSKSPTAAALLARHCLAAGDYVTAIEFLLLAGNMDQAFDVAKVCARRGGRGAGGAPVMLMRCSGGTGRPHTAACCRLQWQHWSSTNCRVLQANGLMDVFAQLVAAAALSMADLERISAYYEARGELGKAADLAAKCEQWARAVTLYLKASR
jgi:WD repeat-containing protein 19